MRYAWLFALLACRSPGSRYYTLVAPPGDAVKASGELQLDVLAVDVPPEVDRAELVVRQGAGEVTPVETRSWIAPLPLELRRALADDLTRLLGARDVAGLSPGEGVPTFRIKLAVRSFESELGKRAVIDTVWSVRQTGDATPALTCSSRAEHAAAGDYDGLVEAHQQALGKIAAAIAAGVRSLQAARPACP